MNQTHASRVEVDPSLSSKGPEIKWQGCLVDHQSEPKPGPNAADVLQAMDMDLALCHLIEGA